MIKKILFLIILTVTIAHQLSAADPEVLWGISKDSLINRLKLENYTTFKPEDRPEYNNRIINFFTSMNPEAKTSILILRAPGSPEIDYCFFNERLYSISENWGDIDKNKVLNLENTIKTKYSDLSPGDNNSNMILSFQKNKTKGVLCKQIVNENTIHINIFYYSVSLFNLLFTE